MTIVKICLYCIGVRVVPIEQFAVVVVAQASAAGWIADDGAPFTAPDGRGRWLTRRLFPEMIVTTSPAGPTVTVFAAC